MDANLPATQTQDDDPAGSIPAPSSDPSTWPFPKGSKNKCWRNINSEFPAQSCNKQSTSPSGLCDEHIEEMREW